MALSAGGGRRGLTDINVTPFIDIMLVLVVLLMIALPKASANEAKLKESAKGANEVEVELARSSIGSTPIAAPAITVEIRPHGDVRCLECKTSTGTADDLVSRLPASVDRARTKIAVKPDRRVTIDEMARVVSALGEARFANFHIVFAKSN